MLGANLINPNSALAFLMFCIWLLNLMPDASALDVSVGANKPKSVLYYYSAKTLFKNILVHVFVLFL